MHANFPSPRKGQGQHKNKRFSTFMKIQADFIPEKHRCSYHNTTLKNGKHLFSA
jgi:hypothetical protein